MVDQDKSCVDCIIHVGVVTVQLLVLQHKSWFGLSSDFRKSSRSIPPLAACGAPSKDIFLTRIFPAYGAPSRSVEQCNQSSCLRFLAINAEGKASGDSYRKCDLWPPTYVKTNSYLLHSIQQNIHPTNKGGYAQYRKCNLWPSTYLGCWFCHSLTAQNQSKIRW